MMDLFYEAVLIDFVLGRQLLRRKGIAEHHVLWWRRCVIVHHVLWWRRRGIVHHVGIVHEVGVGEGGVHDDDGTATCADPQ